MLAVNMSVAIQAERRRVWRALVRPDEMAAWDPVRSSALAVPPDYPKPGVVARWRAQLRGVPMLLVEEPLEVTPAERLRAELRLALVRLETTWTLGPDPVDQRRTRVSLKVVSPNSIPLVGGLLDRFGVRGLVQELVDESLRALRAWCEDDAPAA